MDRFCLIFYPWKIINCELYIVHTVYSLLSLNCEKHLVKYFDQRKYSIFEKFLWKQVSLKSGWWAKLKEPAFYLSRDYLSWTRHTQKENFQVSPSFFPRKKLLFFRGDKTCLDPFSERNETSGQSQPKNFSHPIEPSWLSMAA